MALLDLSGEASIVLCGAAGQGVQTVEQLLMRILLKSGYHVFSTSEFMSRIRGGSNSTEIRVAGHPVDAFVNRIDILVAFHRDAIAHLRHRISADTLILGEEEAIGPAAAEGRAALPVPFTQIATEVGNRIYANTVAVGALAGMLSVDPQLIADYVAHVFASRTEQIISDNKEAVRRGYEIGHEFVTSGKLSVSIPKAASGRRLLLSGTEAVSLGAVAGGCNFISSYPMSPATGVLTYLAQHGAELGMVAEQAEDEISAINMALGASYAGARAMVTTSGGGFALMEEGVSLAGAAELPVVIHLSQRPGPATGLPTRTEQGDLLMALHSGHGEFPRIILAPGTAQDAFYLTQSAFNLADKHQVPVFVLTDQYLVDSSYAVPDLDLEALKVERHIVETDAGYGRYRVTDDGVSPRGVPGFGAGLAVADSHEHDEAGHMTERMSVRVAMVDKRLRKAQGIIQDALPPELLGPESYRTLVLGWGSTYHAIAEAVRRLGRPDVAFLHLKQVYPLPPEAERFLRSASKTVVVENNATGQLATLIQTSLGIKVDHTVLQYDGMPFAVEDLGDQLARLVE